MPGQYFVVSIFNCIPTYYFALRSEKVTSKKQKHPFVSAKKNTDTMKDPKSWRENKEKEDKQTLESLRST